MEFPSIYIETRDDSPVPEQRRARTPANFNLKRARTPVKRASTPKTEHRARTPSKYATTPRAEQNRSRTPGKLANTPRTSAIARPVQRINTAVVFADDMDLSNLSPLTGSEDEDEDKPEEEDEDMLDASEEEHSDEERLIPKPKGEAGRLTGGYSLFETLGWNQRIYDTVQVSKCGIYKEGIYSPITRHSSQRLLRISLTRQKAIGDRVRRKYSSL
jgi:hypothetical protein